MAAASFAVAIALVGCSSSPTEPLPPPPVDIAAIEVTSRGFTNGVVVRPKYTCDGLNLSPDLSWTGVPAEAVSTVVLVDDPGVGQGAFTHWLVYDLPPTIVSFDEGKGGPYTEIAGGGFQSATDFGFLGYAGPCPPEGEIHSYFVHVYALDTEVGFVQATREEVVAAMAGHIIGHGTFRGLYQRTPPSEGGVVFGNTPTP
jgi:hypothetical protein